MEPEIAPNNEANASGAAAIAISGGVRDSAITTNVTNNYYGNSSDSSSTGLGTTPAIVPNLLAWPTRLSDFESKLANRNRELSSFCDMISGSTSPRALFFKAPSDYGKTTLITECQRYAHEALTAEACVLVDFKSTPSKEDSLETLRFYLGSLLPQFSRPNGTIGNLRSDLYSLSRPVVLFFDSYEKATSEARDFLLGLLLGDLARLPAVRLVVAGQQVPNYNGAIWALDVQAFDLKPIVDVVEWEKVIRQRFPALTSETPEFLRPLALAARGIPGTMCSYMQAAADELANPSQT